MCCCAARTTSRGKAFPLGAPSGWSVGKAQQAVALPTASRLRRADTPICKKAIPRTKLTTIAVPSRAHSSSHGSTYLSGKSVQTNRATSIVGPAQRPLPLHSSPPKSGSNRRWMACYPITPTLSSPSPTDLPQASWSPAPGKPPRARDCSRRQGQAGCRCHTAWPDRPAARPGSGS